MKAHGVRDAGLVLHRGERMMTDEGRAGHVERDVRPVHRRHGGVGAGRRRASQPHPVRELPGGTERQRGHELHRLDRQPAGRRVVRKGLAAARFGSDPRQPRRRVGDVRMQRHDRGIGEAAAAGDARIGPARQGRLGDEARGRRLPPTVEVAAQALADDGERDVVDGRAVHAVAHPLDVAQTELDGIDDAVGRHRRVEPGVGCLRRDRMMRLPAAPPDPRGERVRAARAGGDQRRRAGRGLPPPRERPAQRVHRAARDEVGEGRRPVEPRGMPGRRRAAVGGEFVQRGEQRRGRRLALRREVDLEAQREAAGRQAGNAVEPVDHVALPQRPRAVERLRVEPRHLRAQLRPVAGPRQRDVAQVKTEVGGGVVDPVGPRDRQRHRDDAPAEDRAAVQAIGEEALDVGEVDAPRRRGGRVVDHQRRRVHRRPRRFEIQVQALPARQLLHCAPRQAVAGDRRRGFAAGRATRAVSGAGARGASDRRSTLKSRCSSATSSGCQRRPADRASRCAIR